MSEDGGDRAEPRGPQGSRGPAGRGTGADRASSPVPLPVALPDRLRYREFTRRREGMIYAMDGGLWLHRHVYRGEPMAHLVSVDRELLLDYGRHVGLPEHRLQYKPLKDPRTGVRHEAWHWDLVRQFLPPKANA